MESLLESEGRGEPEGKTREDAVDSTIPSPPCWSKSARW